MHLVKADTKKDNKGKDRDIVKVTMQMKHSVEWLPADIILIEKNRAVI